MPPTNIIETSFPSLSKWVSLDTIVGSYLLVSVKRDVILSNGAGHALSPHRPPHPNESHYILNSLTSMWIYKSSAGYTSDLLISHPHFALGREGC